MNRKLLLVDDEEGIRKVLGIALSDAGYTVFTAKDGEEALDIFRKEIPPIVLTDIKMPGMDGIELLQKIKQENPDTEVIMITGHGDMDSVITALRLGAVDYFQKPVELSLETRWMPEMVRDRSAEYRMVMCRVEPGLPSLGSMRKASM